MHDYDAHDIQRFFGLSPGAVRALVRAGHIQPIRQQRGFSYSFQDLLVLRTVKALRIARISSRKIHIALRTLRASLATDMSTHAAGLTTVGERVGIRDGHNVWEVESGQYALALEIPRIEASVHRLRTRTTTMHSADDAHQRFLRALEVEETDGAAACAAYGECLALDPRHPEARINLGRLLHLAGHLMEAEVVYRQAHDPNALLSFNLAIVLEDLDRENEAIVVYREAIAQDPTMADAHFNLARLQERAGDARASFRHLLAYRRLINQVET